MEPGAATHELVPAGTEVDPFEGEADDHLVTIRLDWLAVVLPWGDVSFDVRRERQAQVGEFERILHDQEGAVHADESRRRGPKCVLHASNSRVMDLAS